MNAPSQILPALRLDRDQLHNIIAKTNALLANPERGSLAWLNWLCACDVLIGNDALTSEIETAEYDLGYGDADEPLGDDREHDERVAWDMARTGTTGGVWF